FLHGDVWGGNMLWEGDRCVALIDWKGAGVGDPGVDLGSLRMQMALQYGQDAPAHVLEGWQRQARRAAVAVPYWDAVAGLNPLAGDAPRADLAGVEVLDDVRRDQRGKHEDADGRVRVVADLVRALLAARERDDVALAQLLLALVRAQRRLAAEDDRPFLVRVVGVKWPLLVTRLDLVHARADQLGVGVRADPGVLEAPALALFRAIPLVCVEIEDLHAASLVA